MFRKRCYLEFLRYVHAVGVPEIDMVEEKEKDTKLVACP